MIKSRFPEDAPELINQAWLMTPVDQGGLGINNTLFDILATLSAYNFERYNSGWEPSTFEECIADDKKRYEEAKQAWLKRREDPLWREEVEDEWFLPDDEAEEKKAGTRTRRKKAHPFITFEEYVIARRWKFTTWGNVWRDLSQVPEHSRVVPPAEVVSALKLCDYDWMKSNFHSNTTYWKSWMLLFGPEMLETFGSFTVMDKDRLPSAMIEIYRNLKTRWDQ